MSHAGKGKKKKKHQTKGQKVADLEKISNPVRVTQTVINHELIWC